MNFLFKLGPLAFVLGGGFLRAAAVPGDERLAKYPDIVRLLRAGKTIAQTAKLAGVGHATVNVIKRAMRANGEVL